MKIEIVNVEHGFFAYVVDRNGDVLLIDCGHGNTIQPSNYLPQLGINRIRRFFVTNYDEDHISDLIAVRQNLHIDVLTRNTSVSTSQLRSIKTHPISPAMTNLLNMIDNYSETLSHSQVQHSGVQVWMFHNDYPGFSDTNNLSLLLFVDVGAVSFAIGGDLEKPGWLKLLENPHVQGLLKRVNVFVASHHGRESGYCPEVFNYCKPQLIVMSDGPIQYSTQEMASIYARHSSGEMFNSASGQVIRKVVTTRSDGNISWNPP